MLFIACNTVKYVPEKEYLLKKNNIYINNKPNKNDKIGSYLVQRPNQSTLGVPLQLHFYNLGNPEYYKTFEAWQIGEAKKYKTYTSIFSKKQAYSIYNINKGFNNWFLRKGQEPIVFDQSKAVRSEKSLKDYFISQGFFDAQVTFDTLSNKPKELEVDYKVTTNKQYYLDTITTTIESPIIDSIYQARKEKSILKSKDPFIFEKFEQEEDRLVRIFRNSGIYHFKKNSMGFWTDSIKGQYYKNIELKIPNRIVKDGDSVSRIPYKIQKVNNINVYTDFNIHNKGKKIQDSAFYRGYNFYSYGKLKYKPKYLTNALFITPKGIYKDSEANLTRTHLRNVKTFSSAVRIDYVEEEDESLTANIYLNPLKKYAITFDLDATTSNIKPFGILGKTSFVGRNMFKGMETVDLSFQGSFLNVSKDASTESQFFNAWEMLASLSVRFPRFLFPWNSTFIIPKHMAPTTDMNISTSFQKNIGLDRQTITTGLGYNWKSSKKISHRIDLFNLQYIKNQNIDNYFFVYNSEYEKLNDVSETVFGIPLPQNNTVLLFFMDEFLNPNNGYENTYPLAYDEVSDVNERRAILIEDVMVPVLAYSFTYNTRENVNDNNFSHFTARLVSAGTFTSLIAGNKNEDGQRVLFDVPVAQYIKAEFEYKKYWELKKDNVLVFRTLMGAAIPYGNSDNIPFSRSYSTGGSNEIRAWRSFDLGPGGELNNLEYKVGTFKMVTNLEYRFSLTNKIYSALFIDAGNIWDITNSDLVSPKGKFTSLESLKNTAIGSGFGIRYDFGFLVFRFDTGFKTYEPYLESSNKWFKNYNFSNAVYNIGINYPF